MFHKAEEMHINLREKIIMNNEISYTEAVNKALIEVMSIKSECVCMGLGINDPKRIFGTTTNLLEMFGKDRVIEPLHPRML